MPVFYKKYQNVRKGGNQMWYGRAVHPSTFNLDSIADLIQKNSTFTIGDVRACLAELVTVMNSYLMDSCAVRLDGLGIFKAGLKTRGAVEADEFGAANIADVRINFFAHRKRVGNGRGSKYVKVFTDGLNVKLWDYSKGAAEDEPENGDPGTGA